MYLPRNKGEFTVPNDEIRDILGSHPVVAAVRDVSDLEKAVNSPIEAIFLMCGDILSLKEIVDSAKEHGKFIFIHIELIKGIGSDQQGVEYLAKYVKPDGIVTTKNHLIKATKKLGMYAIQQVFLIDTQAFKKSIQNIRMNKPDAIELMPALMPRVIREIVAETSAPVVAGGLVHHKSEIANALEAGAVSVAVGQTSLW